MFLLTRRTSEVCFCFDLVVGVFDLLIKDVEPFKTPFTEPRASFLGLHSKNLLLESLHSYTVCSLDCLLVTD